MGRHDEPVAPVHAGDLLDGNRVRRRVEAPALKVRGHEHPEEPEARHLRDGVLGELPGGVEFRGDGTDFLLCEFPHLLPDHLLLGSRGEVHRVVRKPDALIRKPPETEMLLIRDHDNRLGGVHDVREPVVLELAARCPVHGHCDRVSAPRRVAQNLA